MPKLKLDAIRDETPQIRMFQFSAADGEALPSYTAGAHLKFDLGDAGERNPPCLNKGDLSNLFTFAAMVAGALLSVFGAHRVFANYVTSFGLFGYTPCARISGPRG